MNTKTKAEKAVRDKALDATACSIMAREELELCFLLHDSFNQVKDKDRQIRMIYSHLNRAKKRIAAVVAHNREVVGLLEGN